MKELTIEEKAKRYDEAIEKLRSLHDDYDTVSTLIDIKEELEHVFPELKESEDEKIRKEIIESLQRYMPTDELLKEQEMISWLEKQGELKTYWKPTKEQYEALDYAYNGCPDTERGNYYESVLETLIEDLHRLEKQGEQKQNPYSGTSFEYNGHTFRMCAIDNGVEILLDGELKAFISSEKSFVYPIHPQPDLASKNAMEAIKEEKVDRQNSVKPVDKPEPKFKVGDWITDGYLHYKISDVLDDRYIVDTKFAKRSAIPFKFESYYHLWTIQDAKDGDVLIDNFRTDTDLILFKEITKGWILAHCGWNNYELSVREEGFGYGNVDNTKYVPATKEQRDLLFQKMKEAGYEWDAEKKELKLLITNGGDFESENCEQKIEDEEYNGEDYGIDSLYHAQRILEKTLGSVDGYQTDDGILEHKCAISAVKKLYKQKPAWSEEDEEMFDDIIADIQFTQKAHNHEVNQVVFEREIDWLKSLKERMKGK